MRHAIRPGVLAAVLSVAACLAGLRAVSAVRAVLDGRETELLTIPLGVIFPLALIAGLTRLAPTRTREGALMRLGTMLQLTAMIGVPSFALHLALGLPVVFLVVELFETRFPPDARERIARGLVA